MINFGFHFLIWCIMKRSVKILLFVLSSLTLISWDRATKELAKEHLANKAPVSYFHNTIRLEYVENTGAALNLGDNLPKAASFWLLSVIPFVFLSGLFFYGIKRSKELSIAKLMTIALIFAGGMGNIIDRVFNDRHGSDFMNVGISNFRTGIFNFADMCVTAGAIMFAVLYYKQKNMRPLNNS